MIEVSVKAPAKLNLSLDIVGKRPDGYHDVAMVLQAISLYDTIKLSIDKDDLTDKITLSCNDPLIPLDESNIVCKSVRQFYKFSDVKPCNINIDINKTIPSQAGLAGGSTDGAATILALNYIFDTKYDIKTLAEIASRVGADVPFCLYGGTMLAKGTGTTLSKLPSIPKCFFVVVKPSVSVSTKEAYDACDSRPYKQFSFTNEVVKKICEKNVRAMSDVLYNEFEAVLNLEDINEVKKDLRKNKALGTSMSGSGSVVYGIFLEKKKAKKCIEKLKDKYSNIYLCEPLKDGCKII